MKKLFLVHLLTICAVLAAGAQEQYSFKCTDWVSTDDARAPQSAFSYDTEANTFTVAATGNNNAAFKMNSKLEEQYYITNRKKWFVIEAKNIRNSLTVHTIWWFNGNNIGGVAPSLKIKTDSTVALLWNITDSVGGMSAKMDYTNTYIFLSASGSDYINAIGLTASNNKGATVTNIDYMSAADVAKRYPALQADMGFASAEEVADSLAAEKESQQSDDNTRCDYSFSLTENGFDAVLNDIHTRLVVYGPDILRVYRTKDSTAVADLTKKRSIPVLIDPIDNGFTVSCDTADTDMPTVTLTTDVVRAVYYLKTRRLVFLRTDGETIIAEKEKGTSMLDYHDGFEKSYIIRQTFTIDGGEDLFGLGQIQDGCLSQRGKVTFLEQVNTRVCIPYFYSTKGYAIYWDNYSPTTFNGGDSASLSGDIFFQSTGTEIDYYLLAGGTSANVLADVRELTGHCPMPALWNFGLYQSKERYESAAEVRKVVQKYRKLRVPLDCIVQDWQYWGTDSKMWNAMGFYNTKFKSTYKTMMDSVHNNHAKLMITVWSNFGTSTAIYSELDSMGRLIPVESYPTNCGVHPYDCYASDARDVYWKYLYEGLVTKGIDAYWLDSTEPDYVQASVNELDYLSGFGKTWRALRNAYPYCNTRGVHDHHRNVDGIAGEYTNDSVVKKRVAIMTRSGFIGQQHYGVNTWSGDVTASWENFAKQIPAALNFSVCGIPYWNSDTGGFFTGEYSNGINDPAWRRLYMRWMQFSTFCPLMRFHGTNTPREIYEFGEEGDSIGDYDQILKYVKLRYRLLPYLYSTAWQIASNDKTFMNSLALAFEDDDNARSVKDEYMFGKSFLVAPVLEDQATSRAVYLPDNSSNDASWYNFWTAERTGGGTTVTFSGSIDQLPIYIPAGTILPWGPDVQYSTERQWDSLEIRVYPGADGTFTLYEDECDNYNYEGGARSTIDFSWDDDAQTLTVGTRNGSFNGMLEKRVFNIVLITTADNPADGHAAAFDATIAYDGTAKSVKIVSDGIETVDASSDRRAARNVYDLSGRRLPSAGRYHSPIIVDGKKIIAR